MSQTKWSERQKNWRAETLAKAREREQKEAAEAERKESEKEERWKKIRERVAELTASLAHLVGMPVRYDYGVGTIGVMNEEEKYPDRTPGDDEEVAYVRVYVTGRGYVIQHIAVTYGGKICMSGQLVRLETAVQHAERWVEEHAYGSEEESK